MVVFGWHRLNTVGGAITSGVQQVVGHDYGAEAASLSAKTGQVTSNVGQTLNNVVIVSHDDLDALTCGRVLNELLF